MSRIEKGTIKFRPVARPRPKPPAAGSPASTSTPSAAPTLSQTQDDATISQSSTEPRSRTAVALPPTPDLTQSSQAPTERGERLSSSVAETVSSSKPEARPEAVATTPYGFQIPSSVESAAASRRESIAKSARPILGPPDQNDNERLRRPSMVEGTPGNLPGPSRLSQPARETSSRQAITSVSGPTALTPHMPNPYLARAAPAPIDLPPSTAETTSSQQQGDVGPLPGPSSGRSQPGLMSLTPSAPLQRPRPIGGALGLAPPSRLISATSLAPPSSASYARETLPIPSTSNLTDSLQDILDARRAIQIERGDVVLPETETLAPPADASVARSERPKTPEFQRRKPGRKKKDEQAAGSGEAANTNKRRRTNAPARKTVGPSTSAADEQRASGTSAAGQSVEEADRDPGGEDLSEGQRGSGLESRALTEEPARTESGSRPTQPARTRRRRRSLTAGSTGSNTPRPRWTTANRDDDIDQENVQPGQALGAPIDPSALTMAELASKPGEGRISARGLNLQRRKKEKERLKALAEQEALKKAGTPDANGASGPNNDAEPNDPASQSRGSGGDAFARIMNSYNDAARQAREESSAAAEEFEEQDDMDEDTALERGSFAKVSGGPRIRIVNGQMVIDEDSTVIDERGETRAAVYAGAFDVVEENDEDRFVNSMTYSKKPRGKRWSEEEDELFFQKIREFGTDFALIALYFPGRNRNDIRRRYGKASREEELRLYEAETNRKPIDVDTLSSVTSIDFKAPLPPETQAILDGRAPIVDPERAVTPARSDRAASQGATGDGGMQKGGTTSRRGRRRSRGALDDDVEIVGDVE